MFFKFFEVDPLTLTFAFSSLNFISKIKIRQKLVMKKKVQIKDEQSEKKGKVLE